MSKVPVPPNFVPPVIKKKPRAHPLESKVEAYLKQQLGIQFGIKSWKFSSPNNRGVFDQVTVLERMTIFMEVKAVKGKPSALQNTFYREIGDQNGLRCFVYGHAGVDKFIKRLHEYSGNMYELELERDYK